MRTFIVIFVSAICLVIYATRGAFDQSIFNNFFKFQIASICAQGAFKPVSSIDPEGASLEDPGMQVPILFPPSIEDASIEDPSIDDPSVDDPSVEYPSIENLSIEDPSIENLSIENHRIDAIYWEESYAA